MNGSRQNTALEIWEKISKIYDKLRRIQAKQMFINNLTAPQFNVLEVLDRLGSVPLKKISEELMVTGANITCVVDNLEKDGFVTRVNSKEDRRVIIAELTAIGKEKVEELLPTYIKNISDITTSLSDFEQKELIRLLDKINAN